MKVFRQYDGQPAKLYCEKPSLEEAQKLLTRIKKQCEEVIGETETGFYAKATKGFSIPFCMYIEQPSAAAEVLP